MNKLKFMIYLAFFASISLSAQTFNSSGDTRNQATFESNAPLEDIVGVSNGLVISVNLNPEDLSSAKGKVSVDLNVLKTGIDLRDQHLRSENWLNTEKNPNAVFELKKIAGASKLIDAKPEKVKLHGAFSVNGVTKEIIVDGELTYYKETEKTKSRLEGNLLKVSTEFMIKLNNFGIDIPGMVVGKVDENIKVSATFIATDATAK